MIKNANKVYAVDARAVFQISYVQYIVSSFINNSIQCVVALPPLIRNCYKLKGYEKNE